jgi:hypothetical protein
MTTNFVWSEARQQLVPSQDHSFWVSDLVNERVTVVFPIDVTLREKCYAVYEKWGQHGVYDFVDQAVARKSVEWGTCVPCEHESPFDKKDPTTCLVCGSSERDDNYKLED